MAGHRDARLSAMLKRAHGQDRNIAGDLLEGLRELADYYERCRQMNDLGPSDAITRARVIIAKAEAAGVRPND